MFNLLSRRAFLGGTLATAAAAFATPAQAKTADKVAVIGCGRRGMNHLRTLAARLERHQIVACDISAEACRYAERFAGCVYHNSWNALLENEVLSHVVIAAPLAAQADAADALLARGMHLYADGPIADRSELTQRLSKCARASGATLQFHARHPWAAHTLVARELIEEGVLGRLRWSQGYVQREGQRGMQGELVAGPLLQALLPLLQATGAGVPLSIATLGTPAAFSTEFHYATGHRLLLQATQANPAGCFPAIRGERASLEFQPDHLLLVPEARGEIRKVPLAPVAPSTQHWLQGQPSAASSESFAIQEAACLILETLQT